MKNQFFAAFGTRIIAVCVTVIALFAPSSSVFAAESICKMTLCGTQYTATQQPNILKTKTQTIRVFVKFGDLVERATAGIANVSVSLGAKQGFTANPCDTYIDVNITPASNATAQNGVVIILFGAFNTETCRFKVDITEAPVMQTVEIKTTANANIGALEEGKEYHLEVNGTNVNSLRPVLNTNVAPGTSKITIADIVSSTANRIVFKIKFSATENTQVMTIAFQETNTVCKFSYSKNMPAGKPLTQQGDVVFDTGQPIKGLFMHGTLDCLNNPEAESDNTTLNAMRGLVPTPSGASATVDALINWANITVRIRNTGAAITTPFSIKLYRGPRLISTIPVPNLAANSTATFTYTRGANDQKKKILRSLSNGCVQSATNSGLFETDLTNTLTNWLDASDALPFKAVIEGVVGETNANNNTKIIKSINDL